MIEVVNVNKTFGEKHVLKDINATFDEGKVNMIIGRSGSGKTVLLKNIVGLVTPETGEIYFNGREFVNVDEKGKREIRKEMGMVFQGSALFTSNNVEENVMLPLDLFTKMTKAEKQKRVDFCLDRVGIVNSHHSFPSEISGGMQKRVAIARAIALNPRYLFCDEPNSGLDPQTSILIDQLIREITIEYNITTIVNTHDMNSIMEIGDNICFIYQGNKWWQGSKEDIFTTDNAELNDFVFASNLYKKIKKAHNDE
ncbi:MAG: ATP-binding cassette domain-containing protein [Bacteroidales bacterium]|nr:ATP-binding cassette domain-containing protein [Bacteroidales bacterium]